MSTLRIIALFSSFLLLSCGTTGSNDSAGGSGRQENSPPETPTPSTSEPTPPVPEPIPATPEPPQPSTPGTPQPRTTGGHTIQPLVFHPSVANLQEIPNSSTPSTPSLRYVKTRDATVSSAEIFLESSYDILIIPAGFSSNEELAGFTSVASAVQRTFSAMIECQLGPEFLPAFSFAHAYFLSSAIPDQNSPSEPPPRTFDDSAAELADVVETELRSIDNLGFVYSSTEGLKNPELENVRDLVKDYEALLGQSEPFNSALVIVNVAHATGYGEYFSTGTRLGYAGVLMTETGEVEETSMFVILHELLHTLGLVDEYVSSSIEGQITDLELDSAFNVTKAPIPETLDTASRGTKWDPVPPPGWKGTHCSDFSLCSQHVDLSASDSGFGYQCPVVLDSHPTNCKSLCAGLREGGFYSSSGYFRSDTFCMMESNRLNEWTQLCYGCRDRLKAQLCPFLSGVANCDQIEYGCPETMTTSDRFLPKFWIGAASCE